MNITAKYQLSQTIEYTEQNKLIDKRMRKP